MKLFGELAAVVTLVMFDSYLCQDKGNQLGILLGAYTVNSVIDLSRNRPLAMV